jgi:hypothetical protein
MSLVRALALALVVASGAAPIPFVADVPPLRAADGRALNVAAEIASRPVTAIVFYSSRCPCFDAHRDRLASLAKRLGAAGSSLLIVDSERRLATDVVATKVGDLPLWRDESGALAQRLGADRATETFVFDRAGRLRYRGGIDNERKHLTTEARPYLAELVDQLLAGRAPELTRTKTLGCVLRLR